MSETHFPKPLSISDSRKHESAERSNPTRYPLITHRGFQGETQFPPETTYFFPPKIGGSGGLTLPDKLKFVHVKD